MTKRLLLTGGSGQIGTALQSLKWTSGIELLAPSRAEMDLSDLISIKRFLAGHEIAGIINAGAYTAVDAAESDQDSAWKINAEAPQNLAEFSAEHDIPLIHISTDYVFSGDKTSPYEEGDPIGPTSIYGASKEAGERKIRAFGGRHIILRTAWLLSATGKNFLKTMLRLAAERDEVSIVADQHGSPTCATDLVLVIQALAERQLEDTSTPKGTYHCVNSGFATWAELAEKIFEISQALGGPFAHVKPIKSAAYPTAAKRPLNARLMTEKLHRDFGQMLPHWRESIVPIIRDVLKR